VIGGTDDHILDLRVLPRSTSSPATPATSSSVRVSRLVQL